MHHRDLFLLDHTGIVKLYRLKNLVPQLQALVNEEIRSDYAEEKGQV